MLRQRGFCGGKIFEDSRILTFPLYIHRTFTNTKTVDLSHDPDLRQRTDGHSLGEIANHHDFNPDKKTLDISFKFLEIKSNQFAKRQHFCVYL